MIRKFKSNKKKIYNIVNKNRKQLKSKEYKFRYLCKTIKDYTYVRF